jgi:hypothetical protein
MNEPSIYTLVGLRPDGVSPAIDVVSAADLAGALVQARRFLREHTSCVSVEVWSSGELLAVEQGRTAQRA